MTSAVVRGINDFQRKGCGLRYAVRRSQHCQECRYSRPDGHFCIDICGGLRLLRRVSRSNWGICCRNELSQTVNTSENATYAIEEADLHKGMAQTARIWRYNSVSMHEGNRQAHDV